jgi:rhodanese-related sulfurtransferase
MVCMAAVAMAAWLVAGAPAASIQDGKALEDPRLRISWTEFKPLYDKGAVEVVDVRGQDAFELGHIPGARSIPLDEVERRAGELKKLNKPVVLYCA